MEKKNYNSRPRVGANPTKMATHAYRCALQLTLRHGANNFSISTIHGISGAVMLYIRDTPLGKSLCFYTANGTAILDIIADVKNFEKDFYDIQPTSSRFLK